MVSMSTHESFARAIGELAESFNFNRSLGQIYGYLYFNDGPLCLDDIASGVMMSKGNASVNLRTLEEWGAIRPVFVSGTRKDYYEANRDVREVAVKRLQEGLAKRFDRAQSHLDGLTRSLGSDSQSKLARKRLRDLVVLMSTARRSLKTLPVLLKLLP
jgi:DNA-binding transcriptional regulator GbsR (MarR family)